MARPCPARARGPQARSVALFYPWSDRLFTPNVLLRWDGEGAVHTHTHTLTHTTSVVCVVSLSFHDTGPVHLPTQAAVAALLCPDTSIHFSLPLRCTTM
jgi:hypothetical protein